MSFRRDPREAALQGRWRKFLQATQSIADRTGVPISILSDQHLFEDFLMHGYIDHHQDPTRTCVDDLDDQQRLALKELIVEYLAHGFEDPGLGIFSSREREVLKARATGRRGGKHG